MTTGTRTLGGWVQTSTPSGPVQTGFVAEKTWGGTDYPVSPKEYTYHVNRQGIPFRKRVFSKPLRRALTVEHPYWCTWAYESDSVVARSGDNGNRWYYSNWSIFEPVTPVYRWTDNDDLALIGRLRDKIAGSSFNAAVSLAEAPQALKLIATSAKRIALAIDALRRGQLYRAAAQLGIQNVRNIGYTRRNIAELWLELQYGWKPLVSDIYAGAQFLGYALSAPLETKVRVGKQVAGSFQYGSESRHIAWGSLECYTRKSIIARISEVDVPQLSGLKDPLSVLWEKLPWSFVIDWAIPIGNYLAARGLSQALTGQFITSRKDVFEAAAPRGLFPNPSGLTDIVGGPRVLKSGGFSRVLSTTLEVPMPAVKPLSKIASWGHAANALALLEGLRRPSKPVTSLGGTVFDLGMVGTMTLAEVRELEYYSVIAPR